MKQSLVKRMKTAIVLATIIAGVAGIKAAAEPGVTPAEIVFAQVAAFEGPAASIGMEMRRGIIAAFEEVNRAGGVKGRKLKLLSADDGNEPTKSIEATQKFVSDGNIFAFIGAVGTISVAAAQPIAAEAGIPFLAPITGAQFLREPFKPNVVNIRASYFEMAEAIVERLTMDAEVSRIALLYQDDAFGRAVYAGVIRALEKRGMKLAAEGSYERNSLAVKSAVLTIQRAAPDAIILTGSHKPVAEFIRLARLLKVNSLLLTITAGSNALAQELGSDGTGVVMTHAVPFPEDATLPVVARYQAALKATDPNAAPGFVSFEGYLAGRLAIAALQKEQNEPARADLLKTIFSNSFDLGGVKFSFSASNNQGTSTVFFTILQPDGTFKSVDHLDKPASSMATASH
jgi:branched-chain amino acid transport system substrate-binding protein